MQHRRQVIGLALMAAALAVATAAPAQAAEDYAEPAKEKHQMHWWESKTPARKTATEQLAYANSLKESGSLRRAAREYRKLVFAWPDSPEAPVAQLNYAQWLQERGKYTKAFNEYQYLLQTYAGYIPYDLVLEKQYAVADTLATRNRYFLFFKFQTPEEAIPLFETMIQNGPQWSRASELQFRIARIFEKNKQFDLAADAYGVYRQRYPFGALAEQAGFGQAQCFYRYAMENPCAVDLRETAVGILQEFLDRYPRGEMTELARTYLKDLQTRQAGDLYTQAVGYDQASRRLGARAEAQPLLVAAQTCYRRVIDEFPDSAWADTARSRIKQINERLEQLPAPATAGAKSVK